MQRVRGVVNGACVGAIFGHKTIEMHAFLLKRNPTSGDKKSQDPTLDLAQTRIGLITHPVASDWSKNVSKSCTRIF